MRKGKPQQPRQYQRDNESTDGAFPRLVGTDVAAKLVPTKEFSTSKRRHIVQFRCEDHVKQVAVRMVGVCQEPEMTKHPSDINEANDGMRHLLELALCLIAKNWDHQDHRNRKHRERHEKPIPAGPRVTTGRSWEQ